MIGLNIPGRGQREPAEVWASGARLVRFVPYPDYDANDYIDELAAFKLDAPGPLVLFVLDGDCLGNNPDAWRGILQNYHRLYGNRVGWQIGNEADHRSPSSWTQSQSDVSRLLRLAREVFGPEAFILGPGLASGEPTWAATVDWRPVDGIAVHPYGKRPTPDWPASDWGTGYVVPLLDGYRQFGKPLYVTEIGVSTDVVTEALQAEYVRRMLPVLDRLTADVYWFCISDTQVPKFGLKRTNEARKPAWAAFVEVAEASAHTPGFVQGFARIADAEPGRWEALEAESSPLPRTAKQRATRNGKPGSLLWGADLHAFVEDDGSVSFWDGVRLVPIVIPGESPIEPQPAPEPPGAPSQPAGSPWDYWTPDEIAAVSRCPGAAVRANWPLVWRALADHQINGQLEQMAAIGTIAIETAHTFAPVREAFWLSEEWRRANLRYYPFYGRGLIQLTWDYNYRTYGGYLGIDLVGNPDLALDAIVSARVLARYFVERNVYGAAAAQDWTEVRRLVQGGSAGLDELLRIVHGLGASAAPADVAGTLQAILAAGRTRLGDPYVWDGDQPGGFDCSGFVSWAYATQGLRVTSYTDAIFGETAGLAAGSSLPGDIVLFEYHDPSQPGVRFPHVGLIASAGGGRLLDASAVRGVSERAMISLGTLHYRRHPALE